MIVCPGSAVDALLARTRVDHVLALVSPDAEVEPRAVPATILRFNDIAAPRPDLIAPSSELVREIIGLGHDLPAEATLLVHCFAGVSRSPAAAYILACAAGGPGEEVAIATRLREASPKATPNPLIVSLADDMLGRGGAMSAAIAAIGRGADAYEGDVIDWTLDAVARP
ncbi:protein tyrosine phosphatase [Caulobacter segnis]|uniref:Protein tyrosine phosphatase n=1 Tax=Caulobacter segnis TaxID=88688 RepID=A0ABM6TMB6_9CAUL|nr:protein tyrosine phosphatase [Caulobacter segnis]